MTESWLIIIGNNCPSLNGTINGEVEIILDSRNEIVAQYTCQNGFKLVGNQNRTCQQSDSTWIGQIPLCIKS